MTAYNAITMMLLGTELLLRVCSLKMLTAYHAYLIIGLPVFRARLTDAFL